LIYPPVESFFNEVSRIFCGLASPLGLLYLAKILENDGDKVTLLDFSAEKFEKQKLTSALQSADVVGMTVLTPSLKKANEIINLIKENKPEIPIVIGGPHCTLFPEKMLEEMQADIGVQGDGETVITEIKKAIKGEKIFSEIPGIRYREQNTVKQGAPVQFVTDLDSIPFPARYLVKKYTYGIGYNPNMKKGEFTSIVTSRGCPFNCRFCSRGSIGMQRYRTRSTENILEELREIYGNGYRYVAFTDDCFPSNKKQAHAIFDAIINEHIDMKFYITAARVDSADKELYKKMKKAGVIHIQFGLESGNQDVLDFYNKHTTIEKIGYAANLSHDTGFFTTGSFILGAPFETKQYFTNTINFAKSLPLDSVSFLPLRYMAGSELWFNAVNEGKISADEYLVQANSDKGLGLFTEEDMIHYCKKAQQAFYLRPKFIVNLFISSLRKNDFTFLRSYISLFFSHIGESINFLRLQPRKK